MSYIILLFGIVILVIGAVMLVAPDSIFGLIIGHTESLGLHVLAVFGRFVFGIALITYAAESHYPVALQVLGWLTITAAIILGTMGRSRFKGLTTWALSLASAYGRFVGGGAFWSEPFLFMRRFKTNFESGYIHDE